MELIEINEFKSSLAIRKKLLEIGISKTYKAGSIILNEHTYVRSIPIITEGSVKVLRLDENGREILLYYITAGETCIMSFLSGLHDDTSKVKAIAEENTTILFIPIDKINLLIKDFPEWLDYIFRLYHQRFEELLEVINAIAFKKMDERLLSFLQRKCALSESNVCHITHEQIANEMGTVRVVVSRLLKQMEDNNIIQLGRNKITLL